MANFCLALKIAPSEYKQLTNGEIAVFHAENARNIARIENARRR